MNEQQIAKAVRDRIKEIETEKGKITRALTALEPKRKRKVKVMKEVTPK